MSCDGEEGTCDYREGLVCCFHCPDKNKCSGFCNLIDSDQEEAPISCSHYTSIESDSKRT